MCVRFSLTWIADLPTLSRTSVYLIVTARASMFALSAALFERSFKFGSHSSPSIKIVILMLIASTHVLRFGSIYQSDRVGRRGSARDIFFFCPANSQRADVFSEAFRGRVQFLRGTSFEMKSV